jgi:trans-2,3-dihydro-3-hydroxyanthranilate isomerase
MALMLKYDVVDVFTDRPFAGNQLAVVHGTDGLSDGQLLALAREFGYSETSFPSQVSNEGYRVRIFTPGGEIPFAGHPTLGTAWVLRRSGALDQGTVIQQCGAGLITVTFGELVSLTAVPRDLFPCPPGIVSSLLADVGLGAVDLAGSAWVAGTGLTFVYLPVVASAVARARVASRLPSSYPELASLGARDPIDGLDVYAVAGSSIHSRVFVPGLVPEDPATGSAAAGLGIALVASGLMSSGGDYRIAQGAELGRPSTLHGSVTAERGVVTRVSVAGAVQPIASGEIAVPPG